MPFSTLTSILLIIGGIITAIIGKFLLRLIVGIASGGILAYIIAKLVLWLHGGTMAAVLLGVLAFIIGFFLGWFILKLALSVIIGIALGVLIADTMGFMGNLGLLLLTVIIMIGISYLLSEKILSLLVMIAGAVMVYLGLLAFTTPVVASIIAFIVFILIAILKIKK